MPGVDGEEYERIVSKAGASLQSRSGTEEEVERLLGKSVPGVLSDLYEEHSGAVRPMRDDLNERLTAKGREEDLSPNTVYDWLRKYEIRRN